MAESPMTDQEYKKLRKSMLPMSRLNTFVYKLSGGRVMGKIKSRPVVLLTYTGAQSGKLRTVPLMYIPYQEGAIVVGSQGGAPKSPAWVKSLQANPDVVVQYMRKKMQLRARQVDDAEKAALWPICVKHYPLFVDYQARTDRNIPVFVCEPRR